MTAAHTLILGGARSGKSRRAEQRAAAWLATPGHSAVLVATALAGDAEMQQRIERHRTDRAQRVPGLLTLEEPLALPEAVLQQSTPQRLVLVDCLTLWLTNLLMPLHGAPQADVAAREAALIAALHAAPGPVLLVSNEIGMGVLPMSAEARAFVDALGRLHQAVAAACAQVTLMVAGCALAVKGAAA